MNLTRPRKILSDLGITSKMLTEWTGYSKSQISQVLNNHRDTPIIQEAILRFALPSVKTKERDRFTLAHLFGPWSYKARRENVKESSFGKRSSRARSKVCGQEKL